MIFFRLKVVFNYLWYCIYRPHRNGHGIHSPFLFAFLQEVVYAKTSKELVFVELLEVRRRLLKSKEVILIQDFGAGSHHSKQQDRKLSEIVRKSSLPHKYGLLFYHTIRFFSSEIILELGTCLGFGAMYMASVNKNTKVLTVEGSNALAEISEKNIRQAGLENITILQGNFDTVLPEILNKNSHFDFIFIDGNHRKIPVLNYFRQCMEHINGNFIIVIDDIRLSEEMFEAWREICDEKRVTLSLDLFRMGIVFFNEKLKKQHFNVYY
jgi:predicted O-methyltransferase YrrM